MIELFTKKTGIKQLVFTILTREYPLKIIELTNFIRKRYGKSITFQAVRKALKQLEEEGILQENEGKYSLCLAWVDSTQAFFTALQKSLISHKKLPASLDSLHEDTTVFTFETMNEAMIFWEDIIEDWYKKFTVGDPHINAFQGAHAWEGILHIEREKLIMEQLKIKGIQSYSIITSNSSLDKSTKKFYNSIGVRTEITPSQSSFDKKSYLATYGEIIIQVRFSDEITEKLDAYFKKTRSLDEMNIAELSSIANTATTITMTVIKNLEMAKQINKSILAEFN